MPWVWMAMELDPDPNGYLMHFEDGPMRDKYNVENLAGTTGNLVVKRDYFGWPLPQRLVVSTAKTVGKIVIWDADNPPQVTYENPELKVFNYEKTSESTLKDDSSSRVMRGASYRLERDGSETTPGTTGT